MSQLTTTPEFDREFELFQQSNYYEQLVDDASEWHAEVRAVVLSAYIDLIQKSTVKDGDHIPEVSRFAYFAINQRADQSEAHVSLYTDLLPEHLSVDHNPRKLFLAIRLCTQTPEDFDSSAYGNAVSTTMNMEPWEIVQFHSMNYPTYIHPLAVMPGSILQFLTDQGYQAAGLRIVWQDRDNASNLRGPITLLFKSAACKYKHIEFTYDHQVFIEDYQWLAANAPSPEEKHGQET